MSGGDKRIPAAVIRAAWLDRRISTAQAAARVGLSRSNLWLRAKRLGLPPRGKGGRIAAPLPGRFAELWLAGVRAADIGALCGLSLQQVGHRARELGLPKRAFGQRTIPLAAWAEAELGRQMAAQATVSTTTGARAWPRTANSTSSNSCRDSVAAS